MSSIFTKIINRELPGYIIYENEFVISFLTLDQVSFGHCLVVPKVEVDCFYDVPADYATQMFLHSQQLAKAIVKATGCLRVTSAFIGLEVPHCHQHLIPVNSIGDFDFKKAKQYPKDECEEMKQKIIDCLDSL